MTLDSKGETAMKIFDDEKLNPDVADALYELNNVGAGQASIALSKMMGMSLSIGRPKVMRGKLSELPLTGSDPGKIDMGILMTMEKTFGGVVLFVLDKRFLSDLFLKLTGVRYDADQMLRDEESLSATREIANIIAAAYTKAIGAYTGMRLFLSPAMVGMDQVGSLMSFAASHYNISNDMVICVDTSFCAADAGTEPEAYASRIIMLPDDRSVEEMMIALGI